MYKLWRRQLSKPHTPDFNSRKKESSFSQKLATAIKISKKKEEFYIKILTTVSELRPRSSTDSFSKDTLSVTIAELQAELDDLISEQEELVSGLKVFEQQPFYLSKTFLYTMFVRLLEINECSKQRIGMKQRNGEERVVSSNWEKMYQQGKTALTDCYQNLIYFQNYNVHELLNMAIRKQNHRIYSILPPKARKVQVTLKPIARTNSTQMRKTHSTEIHTISKERITELLNKKLVKKEKKKQLQTQKRLQERKKAKEQPITFKQLYGILGVKTIKVEEGYAYRKGLQMDAMQRNAELIEERKKWLRKFESRTSSLKLIRTKFE